MNIGKTDDLMDMDPLAFPWALICSIPDKNSIPVLKNFAVWLTSTLQDRAIHYGITHRFRDNPSVVLHTEPGNEDNVRTAYATIHRDHPEIIVVIHILPEPNSMEYRVMRELTDEYDLIRQGILLQKALTQFEDCDMVEVLGNILQWMSRRLSRFVMIREKARTNFSLQIGDADETTKAKKITTFTMNNVSAAVEKVLHDKNDWPYKWTTNIRAVVQVSGYPSSFNEYDIAKIFDKLRIVKVTKHTQSGQNSPAATVEFLNEFHAAQAAIEYDQRSIDSVHSLIVLPVDSDIRREVKRALSDTVISSKSHFQSTFQPVADN